MILYPAIDLKGGQCVRLLRGDMDQATVFNADPAAQARAFADAGAPWLHVVDLDGAITGFSANENAIREIRKAVPDVFLQVGGGIRTREAIELRYHLRIDRIILGTAALRNPDLVKAAAKEFPFPAGIAVGIDARDGKVAVEGWTEQSDSTAIELARRFEGSGVTAIIYTDINRDGMMQGVNVDATARLAKQISLPVIASGGVSSLDDIRALKQHPGIDGAILGRALYERKFTLADALAVAGSDNV
jgi:phosphoribosylformimino-5-aminoimidazole carboxamide ribotide isomerase